MSGASGAAAVWPMATLVLVFALKHFIADFLLQNRWIACGKDGRTGWFLPLALHVAGHAVLTLAIAVSVAPRLWWLALVDLAIHFAIDRSKCVLARSTRWTMEDARFWWLLGFDQFLHQVTNVGLAVALLVL